MPVTYTWHINQLTAYPTYENQTDVVFKVQWNYRGVDANGIGSSRGAITEITFDPAEKFIPYSELTEAEVLGWVKAVINAEQITQMETEIVGDIDYQIAQASANNPISPPLPWPVNTPTSANTAA